MFADPRSHLPRDILEAPVAEIAVDKAWVLEALAEVIAIDLRVDMSVDLQQVLPAIIVVVDKSASPGHILLVYAEPGGESHIAEGPIAVVVVEVRGIVGEVCLEDIEPTITVVVCDSDAHARLLVPAIAVCAARTHGNIGESSIVIVLKKNAWLGVNGDIDVRPAIIVKVVRDSCDGVARSRLQDARFRADVGEGAIAVVVEEQVRIARQTPRSAHDGHTLPLAKVRVARSGNLLRVELEVVADKEIKKAIAIVVEKGASGSPANLLLVEPGLARHVGKRAVAIVVEELIVAPEAAK